MIIDIPCPFCKTTMRVELSGPTGDRATGGQIDLGSVKCGACDSRVGMTLKLHRRAKGKRRRAAEEAEQTRRREVVLKLEAEHEIIRKRLATEPGCVCETLGFPSASTWDGELRVMRPAQPRHHHQCPANPNYKAPGTRDMQDIREED